MLSSIFHVSRILRVAATCVSLAVTASGLVFAQGVREKIILEGTVRDAAGNPIAAAAVSFEGVTSETAPATRTDANGLFVLKLERADEYKIRVAKEGFRPQIVEVGRFDTAKKRIEVTLELAQGKPTAPMEFSDSPSFTVAGVTDWSNAGLHGSDVNVRTSESLTKDAAALKAANSKAEHTTGAGDEHRLRGDAHEKSGDPVAAEHEYEMAVKLNPS